MITALIRKFLSVKISVGGYSLGCEYKAELKSQGKESNLIVTKIES